MLFPQQIPGAPSVHKAPCFPHFPAIVPLPLRPLHSAQATLATFQFLQGLRAFAPWVWGLFC